MTVERMLELIILTRIGDDYGKDNSYATYLNNHYDIKKLGNRFDELGEEFLNDYALDKTEKSD